MLQIIQIGFNAEKQLFNNSVNKSFSRVTSLQHCSPWSDSHKMCIFFKIQWYQHKVLWCQFQQCCACHRAARRTYSPLNLFFRAFRKHQMWPWCVLTESQDWANIKLMMKKSSYVGLSTVVFVMVCKACFEGFKFGWSPACLVGSVTVAKPTSGTNMFLNMHTVLKISPSVFSLAPLEFTSC